jgi:cytochrome P450
MSTKILKKEKESMQLIQRTQKDLLFSAVEWSRNLEQTVFFDATLQAWNVVSYEDVARVLGDRELFALEPGQQAYPQVLPGFVETLKRDPERYQRLRTSVMKTLTSELLEQLESRITASARLLFDRIDYTSGRIELIQVLANPLPDLLISELLGIPARYQDAFERWSYVLTSGSWQRGDGEEVTAHELKHMRSLVHEIVREKRRQPQDDLLTLMLNDGYDEQELLEFITLLLAVGHDALQTLLCNVVLCFERYPGVLEALRENPALIPSAIEEVLRFMPSVHAVSRVVTADTILGGQQLSTGERVIVWIDTANRDKKRFQQPEDFDIKRPLNQHLAFGHGIYACLGAPLARLGVKVALSEMLDRFPGRWTVPVELIETASGAGPAGLRVLRLPMAWGA